MKPSLIVLAGLAMFAAAACGSADDAGTPLDPVDPEPTDAPSDSTGSPADTTDTSDAADPFGDTTWRLAAGDVDGDALVLLDANPVTLSLDPDGGIGGTAACNNYGGPFMATLDTSSDTGGTFSLTFGALFRTEMACFPDEVNQLESAYLAALGRVTTAQRAGDALTLSGDGIRLDFAAEAVEPAASLTGTVWLLDSVISGDSASSSVSSTVSPSNTEATLSVGDDGEVSGSTGCNRFNGTISIIDDRFEPAALATTRMACDPVLMEQEQAVMAVLGGGPRWSIDGQTLTLQLDDGTGLVYRAAV
jgi:heat shock protein HslJ